MKLIYLTVLLLLASPLSAFAQTRPTIKLSSDIEDGKKMFHTVVLLNGKPLENVTLQYFVQRTFGNLLLGEDTTLDDGSSAVAFPSDLPGASDGKLHAIVRIKTPAKYAAVSTSVMFPADLPPAPASNDFPRALWAPQAPLALMVSIFAVVACVWLSYFFVVTQILAIRKGGKS